MFDLSLSEIILVVAVAVIFIGPKELPAVIRSFVKCMRSLKAMASEIRQAFDEVAKESGIDDIKKEIDQEVRLIQGDDGSMYESYPIPVSEPGDDRR
ncbi:MAG: Sec-independent protein translocase protein TatB [Rickettsiales bacterium]|nr:Sec-independent protein translocase protein TatB [Rickettsiales bacterium]